MFLWINLKEIAPMDLFMRKHLYFLSYLLILNPFILFANEPISLKKLEENNNIFLIKGTQKPYTGIVNEFYKNKKLNILEILKMERKLESGNILKKLGQCGCRKLIRMEKSLENI